jgi:hypothetical protein
MMMLDVYDLHRGMIQLENSVGLPGHGSPFPNEDWLGAGSLHTRARVLAPAPQVTEHGVQLPHGDQLPLSFSVKKIFQKMYKILYINHKKKLKN